MAIQTGTIQQDVTNAVQTPSIKDNNDILAPAVIEQKREEYSLTPIRDKYKQEILASGEVDKLTGQIDISNTTTIVEFGREPAEEMSHVSDQVLSKYDSSTISGTSHLVDKLLSVMKKVDIDEIRELEQASQKQGVIGKLFNNMEKRLKALVEKYQSVTKDMESICNELTQYEQQIKSSNIDIAKMYDASIQNYRALTAHILAGEQAVKEIEEYKQNLEKESVENDDGNLQFQIQNVSQAQTLMEKQVNNLRGAEAVALQAIPMFKMQEYTNAGIAQKVNSAFLVTVPAFKQALVQSVIMRQQALQMQGLSALDEATSVLIRKNADNAKAQLLRSQQMANTSAIKADDIEYSWNVIMDGIKQYKEMEKQYAETRDADKQRIENANEQYLLSMKNGEGM